MKVRIVKQPGLGYYGEAFYQQWYSNKEKWDTVTTSKFTKLGAYLALRKWVKLHNSKRTIVKEFELQ